jgi:hypothetical protein
LVGLPLRFIGLRTFGCHAILRRDSAENCTLRDKPSDLGRSDEYRLRADGIEVLIDEWTTA